MNKRLTDLHLDQDSYISYHVQLHNLLRQLIVSGRWSQGDRIPSEPQLAKHLDISRTTVRVALQNAETEGLIKRVPGRGTFVDYDMNERSTTRFIGYVTRSFHNEIHRVMLSRAETELRSAGYRMVFSKAKNSNDEVEVLSQLLDDDISGLILWPNAPATDAQRDILLQFQARSIPIVFIDRFTEGISADYVASDNCGGTYALTEHLINQGHRHMAYLRWNISNLFSVDERQRGFEAAAAAHGITDYNIWTINSPDREEFYEIDIYELFGEAGIPIAKQIIALVNNANPRPTAIACVNDALAIVVMRTLREIGLNVPEDISIVGFDDIKMAAYSDVPLTTISQNAHEIGKVAAQKMLERLNGYDIPPRRYAIPTELCIRKSTSILSKKS